MIYLEILLALLVLIWFIGSYRVWSTQDKAIFPGEKSAPFGEDAALKALGGVAVRATRDGQSLRYYWIEAEYAKAVLVLFHGNAGSALDRLDYAKMLKPAGVSVALVEYPGYAGDSGPGGEWPVLRNSLAAYDEIDARRGGASGLPLFVMGESLGTGPATFSASLRQPRAMLLSTPYPSMAAVAKSRYPWVPIYTLIRHPIQASLWAPHVQCPVLILHGTLDKTVPYALGQAESRNFKRLERFVTIEGGTHGNVRDIHQGQFWKACKEFIEAHV